MIAAAALLMTAQSVSDMRDHRRVLIVAAPSAQDVRRNQQGAALQDATPLMEERDVTVVNITADHVRGASDTAASLRRRWHLAANAFTVLLVGKDGYEALRRAAPIDAATLVAAIDAMPMRRAGQR